MFNKEVERERERERERENASYKLGFTLIEMLIVVVIIGILGATLLPRLTGYMARTRDLKRHTDLRNIATALSMYKNNYGEFPGLGMTSMPRDRPYIGKGISHIASALAPYLSPLPTDPQKNSCVSIHWDYWYYPDQTWKCKDSPGTLNKGEYVYQLSQRGCKVGEEAYLIAKIETAEMANYVLLDDKRTSITLPGSSLHYRGGDLEAGGSRSHLPPESLFLCGSIEKTPRGGSDTPASDKTDKCTYSREDQLFYIVRIK